LTDGDGGLASAAVSESNPARVAKSWTGYVRICNNLKDGCEVSTDCAYLD
jgi:hypothetical protein